MANDLIQRREREEATEKLLQIDLEAHVEKWLTRHFDHLKLKVGLIGTQVELEGGMEVDMLAIHPNGRLCVVELKRDEPYREVFIQALDYARVLDGYLPSDIDLICRKYAGLSLVEFFKKNFQTQVPQRLASNPSLVIIAADFDEANLHMASFLKSHRFDLKLFRFERRQDIPDGQIKFKPVNLKDALHQATGKMPDRVLEIRFTEFEGYNWRDCRAENYIALPQPMMAAVMEQVGAKPASFLLYLNNHGYVASGKILPGSETRPCGLGNEPYLEVDVEWEVTVGFEQAIFRSQNDQPEPRKVVCLSKESRDKWSKLVGLLKYREHNWQESI